MLVTVEAANAQAAAWKAVKQFHAQLAVVVEGVHVAVLIVRALVSTLLPSGSTGSMLLPLTVTQAALAGSMFFLRRVYLPKRSLRPPVCRITVLPRRTASISL